MAIYRIGQVEAKSKGVFVESFDNPDDFSKAKNLLEKLASKMGRTVACIVLPVGGIVQTQVYLMPVGWKVPE
jgi:hypothetical protein